MSGRLDRKVCVVTGASSGIGAAIARAFAAEGGAVVGFARRFAVAQIARQPARGAVLEVGLDVTDEKAVEAGFAELSRVDLLVNNAGVGTFTPLIESDVAALRTMLEVHIVGTFLCCREALRKMVKQESGHIVNIGSTVVDNAFPNCSGYTAAKAGQIGLSRVLREECREHGVRVTSLIPGAVNTPIWDDRPGFDRDKMLKPDALADLVVEIVTRPALSIEDVRVVPPGGNL
jgi:3-oxoacyl-[acyl-carrier protein] reductase